MPNALQMQSQSIVIKSEPVQRNMSWLTGRTLLNDSSLIDHLEAAVLPNSTEWNQMPQTKSQMNKKAEQKGK